MIKRWIEKFRFAMKGFVWAISSQDSFWVHLPVAAAVILLAAMLQLDPIRWCVLILCIALVIAAECFNSALEQIAAATHPERDPRIGHALDAGAAAVLVLSIAAIVVGMMILGPPLWDWARSVLGIAS